MNPGDVGTYDVPHQRVGTEYGAGTAVVWEVPYRYGNHDFVRVGVVLDENPFSYPICFIPYDKLVMPRQEGLAHV